MIDKPFFNIYKDEIRDYLKCLCKKIDKDLEEGTIRFVKKNMTKEEILKAAIEKAIASGYQKDNGYFIQDFEKYGGKGWTLNQIVFSHEFAKAFWGEEPCYDNEVWEKPTYVCTHENTAEFTGAKWQYHLQQMVLELDPIKYLEKFL